MPTSWYQRLWLVLFIVLGSIYILLPTFVWGTDDASTAEIGADAQSGVVDTIGATTTGAQISTLPANTAGEAVAADAPAPGGTDGTVATKAKKTGIQRFFPDKRLNLGLDLVGGSHLTLSVDTDEALRSMVAANRRDLRERLAEEKVAVEAVRQPLGTEELEVVLKDPADREKVTGIVAKSAGEDFQEVGFRTEGGMGIATYAYRGEAVDRIEEQAVTQVLELLRTRVNGFGAREPLLYRERGNRIVVQLPGVKDPAFAIQEIKRTARLEFHIVDEEWYGRGGSTEQLQAEVARITAANPALDDLLLNQQLQAAGVIPEDSAVYFEERTVDPKTGAITRAKPLLLKREVVLTGDRVEQAFPQPDRFNNWQVALEFDPEGAEQFADLTGKNTNRRMAIVLEGVVESAPNINEKIEGGSAVITLGTRDKQQQANEASEISRVLRTGALPAPVRIEQNRTVGPSLGQDAINKGVTASLIGVAMVFLFCWVWYRGSGVIATITLMINGTVLLAAMTLFDATLTLPGIAGLILTIGMAVDANVLIYERIREELRAGRAIRTAVEGGFDKAFSSILDGNLTTAAAGAVLFIYGTDQIKGFAIVLLLGIATTLFSALVVTRLMMEWVTIRLRPQQLSI